MWVQLVAGSLRPFLNCHKDVGKRSTGLSHECTTIVSRTRKSSHLYRKIISWVEKRVKTGTNTKGAASCETAPFARILKKKHYKYVEGSFPNRALNCSEKYCTV